MLASYNSGPGNFLRWGADIRDNGDPLLFIEAIPVAETRSFVPRVLVYSWIYAARMHLPAPSLESMAAGEFPRFTPAGEGAQDGASYRGAALISWRSLIRRRQHPWHVLTKPARSSRSTSPS